MKLWPPDFFAVEKSHARRRLAGQPPITAPSSEAEYIFTWVQRQEGAYDVTMAKHGVSPLGGRRLWADDALEV